MNIRPIRTRTDYKKAVSRIEKLMDAKANSPEEHELDALATLVEAYEQKHCPIDLPDDPVEVIKFYMEQQSLTRKDLEAVLGSKGRVADVLNRKRELSLTQIKNLHALLSIPYSSLIVNDTDAA